MASNPLPLIAAAAGAFFLMRATRGKDESGGEWNDYVPPSGDTTPTPDPVTTETFGFPALRGQPVSLQNIQGDGESITIVDVPSDWTFEVVPTVWPDVHPQIRPSKYVGLKVDATGKKLVAVTKNVAELKQLIKAANITGYSATLKGSSPQAQQPMTGVFPDTLVQFQFPA